MWSADGDGGVEGDDEMTDVLNPLKKGPIVILRQITISLLKTPELIAAAVLALIQDITDRRLGTPIGTIPKMLNTSIQKSGYSPSKNASKIPHMR